MDTLKANFCLPLFPAITFSLFLHIFIFTGMGGFTGHSLLLSQSFLLASPFHFHVFVFLTCINQSPHYIADGAYLIGADVISTSSSPFILVSKAVFFNTHPLPPPPLVMYVKSPGCLSLSPCQLLDNSQS